MVGRGRFAMVKHCTVLVFLKFILLVMMMMMMIMMRCMQNTMGDGSLILPTLVIKIIPPPPGMSWMSRDQKLNVEYKYIGFVLNF